MLRAYHRRTVERAEAAVASGRMRDIYNSMVTAALVWCIPAIATLVICIVFGFEGGTSLLVSVPLVAVSIAGACGYVGWIYTRALSRRH